MAGTFATLMLGGLSTLVQIGFALAFGVLLDTFVVRPFPGAGVTSWCGAARRRHRRRPCPWKLAFMRHPLGVMLPEWQARLWIVTGPLFLERGSLCRTRKKVIAPQSRVAPAASCGIAPLRPLLLHWRGVSARRQQEPGSNS